MSGKEIQLHKYQDKAIFAKQRFIALIAGLQSGKTMAGAIWARKKWDESMQGDGLICAPTYKILSQSTLPKFFELNPDLKKYFKKMEQVIEVPGRKPIYIRSTENPNVIEGMTLEWIWADEAGQMKLDAWINFQGRLSILQGQLFISTTPYTMNWLATDFYKNWKEGHKDFLVVQFKSKDNPFFPNEEYERVKATMDPRIFRRRYDGSLEKMEGLVYDQFSIEKHTLHTQYVVNFKEVICGIDWGWTNPSAIAIIGIDTDNNFYIIDEYYKPEKTKDEVIEAMKGLIAKHKARLFYPDPEDPEALSKMITAGIMPREVKKGKGSVIAGIDRVRELIFNNQLKVYNNCIHTLDEFSNYHYPKGKDDRNELELPVPDSDHLMDAIRYAIYTYQPTIPITQEFYGEVRTNFK